VDRELRTLLAAAPVPDEGDAEERAWNVVHAAFQEREPEHRPVRRLRLRPLVAVAAVAALVAAALSPAGRDAIDSIRDRVSGDDEPPVTLTRLPAAGPLLVVSESGPWVVRADGSKRLLGSYEDASWSPRGKFVVVTDGPRITAVEPDSDPRWQLTRPEMVADARWSPFPGFRIAYRAGSTLRTIEGDGTDDGLLARRVAAVPPAWRPRPEGQYVLAFATGGGIVRVADVEARRELWRVSTSGRVVKLAWSEDGRQLLVATRRILSLYTAPGRLVRRIAVPRSTSVTATAFRPGTTEIAYAVVSETNAVSRVLLATTGDDARTVFNGSGGLTELEWSPNGRWLLIAWPDADQWVFLRRPGADRPGEQKLVTVAGIRSEFEPGSVGVGSFPRVTGWCCAR
jgi:WD40 repeat protein